MGLGIDLHVHQVVTKRGQLKLITQSTNQSIRKNHVLFASFANIMLTSFCVYFFLPTRHLKVVRAGSDTRNWISREGRMRRMI